jgi:hypothetical protein
MMNDRFAAQLRQHLLDTANERPADGQVAAISQHVAVTPQRRQFVLRVPELPVWIGRFPAGVRYGLIALALVLAALAGALLAGGGAPSRSTPFEGTWTTTDVADGSTMHLSVGGGSKPTVRFEDQLATGDACLTDTVKVFTAEGVGTITDNRLDVTYPNGGGCGADRVAIGGRYLHDPSTDTLVDRDGLVWTHAPSDRPAPTAPGRPSPSLGPQFEGRWTATDPSDGSTLTLVVGGGTDPLVQFQDALSTGGACAVAEVKVFRADGVGQVIGSRLEVSYPNGGGCGAQLVPIAGLYRYGADTDTLFDQDGVTWRRVPPGESPPPTLRPAPTGPARTLSGGCVDLRKGGTFTAPDLEGSMSVTATVPDNPIVAWYGAHDRFEMSDGCLDPAPMAFHVGGVTSVNDGGCMTSQAAVTDFADALAKLDAPRGNDISRRIDLTIDGHRAARWDVTNLSTCPGFGLWSGTIIGPHETGSIYVIDVDGVLLEIELNRDGLQTQAELDETYAIIASLQFGR